MLSPIRVLVVDDTGFFRRALTAEIEKHPRFTIVGTANDGRAAIAKVRELKPDVVTLDVEMPVMGGLEALRTIVAESTASVVMVSALTENGDPLISGSIYIAPGGSTMRVTRNELHISFEDEGQIYKPSVDALAASALAAFGKNVLGVMLTGMGADGAREFLNLRQLGAYTLAQDQASSVVYGMPKSLVDIGGADEVLPLASIGPACQRCWAWPEPEGSVSRQAAP